MGSIEDFEQIREQLHRQMLSAVSHDLKTPLATIIGALEIYIRMASRLTKEKNDELINSALGEAYRLDNFITNILDMAKLESSMVKVRFEQVNLTYLIKDCIIKLGPRGSRCAINLNSHDGEVVNADPMLLGRAIGMVLENAMKHGGKPPTIDVNYGKSPDGGAFVSVRDHGPGLPQGKEEDIFSKYTRFSKADQQNAGTGLGLAICRRLVELQGGNVHGETHTDGGAEFTLSIPERVPC